MSSPVSPQPTETVETLCLTARARATGGPLTPDEINYYVELMRDERSAPDPDDPPSYDWTGGAPLAGGSQMAVRDTAAGTLKKCGGDALVNELRARFQHANDSAGRAHYAGVAAQLLGCRHALLLDWLTRGSADVRAAVASGILKTGTDIHKHLDLVAPLLADSSEAVIEQAIAVFKRHEFWIGWEAPQMSETFSSSLVTRAAELLQAAPPLQQLMRRQSLIYLTLVAANWKMLVDIAVKSTPEELRQLTDIQCFTGKVLTAMLALEPALAASIRPIIFAQFQRHPRHRQIGLLCCFAPDRNALELALTALRNNTGAACEIVVFVERDPACMPAIVEAAFQNPQRDSSNAAGFKYLLNSNLQAFAQALADSPQTRDARLNTLRSTLECCTASAEVEKLMSQLKDSLARLKPAKPLPNRPSTRTK